MGWKVTGSSFRNDMDTRVLPLESTQQATPIIERLDQGIHLRNLRMGLSPVIRLIPLGHDRVVGLALLFDPAEILEIVDAPAIPIAQFFHVARRASQQIAMVGSGGLCLRVLTVR